MATNSTESSSPKEFDPLRLGGDQIRSLFEELKQGGNIPTNPEELVNALAEIADRRVNAEKEKTAEALSPLIRDKALKAFDFTTDTQRGKNIVAYTQDRQDRPENVRINYTNRANATFADLIEFEVEKRLQSSENYGETQAFFEAAAAEAETGLIWAQRYTGKRMTPHINTSGNFRKLAVLDPENRGNDMIIKPETEVYLLTGLVAGSITNEDWAFAERAIEELSRASGRTSQDIIKHLLSKLAIHSSDPALDKMMTKFGYIYNEHAFRYERVQ